MHIGQPEVAALELVGQAFVVDAHLMENGGLEVVNVNGVLDGVHAEFVALPVGDTGLHAAAGHPCGEGIRVVIAAPAHAVGDVPLDERGPTELPAPDDQRVIEQSAPFEVFDQRS